MQAGALICRCSTLLSEPMPQADRDPLYSPIQVSPRPLRIRPIFKRSCSPIRQRFEPLAAAYGALIRIHPLIKPGFDFYCTWHLHYSLQLAWIVFISSVFILHEVARKSCLAPFHFNLPPYAEREKNLLNSACFANGWNQTRATRAASQYAVNYSIVSI